jgi:hypothetical protein
VVNRAILLFSGFNNQRPVSGTPSTNFDGTPLGIAAAQAYGSVVQTAGKLFGWDFARQLAQLAPAPQVNPGPFQFEYLYPINGIEVRQVVPQFVLVTGENPLNPVPVRWMVGNDTFSGVVRKVIWTSFANAFAYISGQPQESTWDAGFTEVVIRLMASELAMAVGGRPEAGQLEIERMQQMFGLAAMRSA